MVPRGPAVPLDVPARRRGGTAPGRRLTVGSAFGHDRTRSSRSYATRPSRQPPAKSGCQRANSGHRFGIVRRRSAEVRHLLKRGLARLGSRSAHAPHEFAVAALAAGTDAGVADSYGSTCGKRRVPRSTRRFHKSTSPSHFPTKQTMRAGSLPVLSSLADPWFNHLPFEPRDSKQRGRFRGLRGPVEAAIIRVGERPDDAERWQHLLLLLSRQQSRIDRNKSFREELPPLPWLHPDWFARAWPEHLPYPEEVLLAWAIASLGRGPPTRSCRISSASNSTARRKPNFVQGERPPRLVWNDGEPVRSIRSVVVPPPARHRAR